MNIRILFVAIAFFSASYFAKAQKTQNSSSVSFEKHDIDDFTGGNDVWVIDIDGDGFNDIIGTSYEEGISWWKNDGNQNFTRKEITPANPENSARSVRGTLHDGSILDFNNDGFVDIVSTMWDANQVTIWLNDGTGKFTKNVIDNSSFSSHTVDVIDIDKDGDIDILVSAFGNTTENGEFAIYYNNGNLEFTKEIMHTTYTTGGTFIHGGDMDNDGDNDILYTEWHWSVPSDLGWYKKTETGWEKNVIDSVVGFHTSLLKDYDNDGDLDALAAAYNGCGFYIYTNDGSGNFTKSWEMFGMGAVWLDIADFDNDGDNDLVAAAQNPGPSPDLYWLENDGANNFTSNTLVSNLKEVYSATPGDVDKDGFMDIVLIVNEGNKIIWWENKMTATGLVENQNILNNQIEVFPNPNAGTFRAFIENDYLGEVQVKLSNVSGNIIYSDVLLKTSSTLEFNFSNNGLSKGYYVLNLITGSTIHCCKILIMN